jgi:ribonucleoside-diphosphate reductase alpha chain
MESSMQEPNQGSRSCRRRGHTTSATVGGERFSLTATERADGTLYEVRIGCGKHGSAIAGLMDAYATAISAGLQHGVPLADLLRPGLGLCFAPYGGTDDPQIPRVRSAVDYFSRRLAVDWLPDADRAALGVLTVGERVARGADQTGADARAGHLAVVRVGSGVLAWAG